MKFLAASTLATLAVMSSNALADEGLARITQLNDRDMVAQEKARQKARQNTYKAIEDDTEKADSEFFRGNPMSLSNNFFFGAGLDYFDNFGVQARYAARVLDRGFVPDLNNSVYVEGGFGLTMYGTKRDQTGVTGFDMVLTGRWDFQLDPTFIFFGDLGFGYNAVSNDRKDDVKGGGFFPAIGVGAIANFSESWAARADLSYQFLGLGVVRRF